MKQIALEVRPFMCTIVPERREELTTEGGLDVVRARDSLKLLTEALQSKGILVSLFIDPDLTHVQAAAEVGARIVEFHTGRYCEAFDANHYEMELNALIEAATLCGRLGLEVNAGHGLTSKNVPPILKMPGLNELNIGHSLLADAVMVGLGPAVRAMKTLIS
jgi:pyridoxine 5-phosphate synthase